MVAPAGSEETDEIEVAPVKVDGVALLRVRGISSFPAEKRAKLISGRIEALAADRRFSPSALRVEEAQGASRLLAGDQLVLTVTDADAQLEGINRPLLASVYLQRIGEAISSYRHDREPEQILRGSLFAVAVFVVLGLLLWLGARAMYRLDAAARASHQEQARRARGEVAAITERSAAVARAARACAACSGRRPCWSRSCSISISCCSSFPGRGISGYRCLPCSSIHCAGSVAACSARFRI